MELVTFLRYRKVEGEAKRKGEREREGERRVEMKRVREGGRKR